MLGSGGILTIIHILPLIVIFTIIGLELSIAFLQAYVFTVLLCIYLNDAISLIILLNWFKSILSKKDVNFSKENKIY